MGRDLWLRLILLFVFAWKLFAAEIGKFKPLT